MFRKTALETDRNYRTPIAPAALLLLYFVSVHFGVIEGYPLPAILILIGILIAGTYRGLKRGDRPAWLVFSISIAAGVFLWVNGHLALLFYLPSVLVNLVFLIVFGVSLLPGNTPLITRFSRIMKGELDAKALGYTYRVTLAWAIFFAVLLAESLLLAFFASPHLWSIFANFLNYVFLLLFFVVEYRIRVHMFPEVEHPGFFAFVRELLRLDRRRLGPVFGGAELTRQAERG